MIKKILIITLEFPPQIGGIATLVSSFASSLDPAKVIVLTDKFQDAERFDSVQNYKIIRRPLLFPAFIWPRWLRLVWYVWRLVKKEKIEKIIVHHTLPSGYAALLMKWFCRIPFFVFCHGTDVTVGTKTQWKSRLFSFVATRASLIVFSSLSLEDRFLSAFPNLKTPRLILYPSPNKIFLSETSTDQILKIKNNYGLLGKKVLLTVTRIVPGKGVLTLAKLLPYLLKNIPNLVWVVVGTGKELPRVEKEIQTLRLQNVVRFVGDVPQTELPLFYHAADVMGVLTHRFGQHEEGFGLVFLEAASCGIPVVAGQSGGVGEAVENGTTGLVVDTNNENEMREARARLDESKTQLLAYQKHNNIWIIKSYLQIKMKLLHLEKINIKKVLINLLFVVLILKIV